MIDFADLALVEPLLRAVKSLGHVSATPIQAQAIPHILAGRDVCGTAQTGTGKTAAFALPILQRLAAGPRTDGVRALVLVPTRELAMQVGDAFVLYGQFLPMLRHAIVYGGMKQRAQRRAVEINPDIVVATPGRLLDLCGQRMVDISKVECLVLDEADRMLDLGFLADVNKIVKRLPVRRQTLLFSATLPPDIENLAARALRDPVRVSVAQVAAVAPRIEQVVHYVEAPEKATVLLELLRHPSVTRALVFVRTKAGADRLVVRIGTGGIPSEAIHSDRPQPERVRALARFKSGASRVLIATDVAARGIDIDHVSHVFNYDVPNVPETYVHRIGRTARAGEAGTAITLCAMAERPFLADIERLIGQPILAIAV